MNWVDRLRTSADKRMWSGRRAVVMRTGRRAELLGVKLGCPRSRSAPSFQTCFACVHMYILYACVYICVCVYVYRHDICNASWHMDCHLPPLTTIPRIWKCPLCTPPVPPSQGPLLHLRFPSPILDLTLIKHHLEKTKINPSLVSTKQEAEPMIQDKKPHKMPRMQRWRAYEEGSGFKL